MSATIWGPLDPLSAAKRASARDAWNNRRSVRASLRRLDAVLLYFKAGCKPGSQAKVARQLGVHRSTVCRDIAMWYEAERTDVDIRVLEECQRIRQRLDKQIAREFGAW